MAASQANLALSGKSFDEVEYAVAVAVIAGFAMIVRLATRVSAFNGVANMTIRFLLRSAFVLYSHNALLCPPTEQMAQSYFTGIICVNRDTPMGDQSRKLMHVNHRLTGYREASKVGGEWLLCILPLL
ncbi:hypothetical protein [Sphingobium algorifonticola]|uniref:Uncharacterized protein n=1 Tax=Sphingobium algorifonticola TaxID=2008318 RepID=A0A437J3D2_9SPHN|nr:hypothetical protein [Sphingobium algorifonticola]RVT38894.1 hypothetical protein ENE74_17040 [Sphingobium algorifonticola]